MFELFEKEEDCLEELVSELLVEELNVLDWEIFRSQ